MLCPMVQRNKSEQKGLKYDPKVVGYSHDITVASVSLSC